MDSILTHVGLLGWGSCVWTEENLASKRLFPGHAFSSIGNGRQESLRFMCNRVQKQAEMGMAQNASKKDVNWMEQEAEKAAAITSLAKEFCQEHAVATDLVEQRILVAWANGDERIDMELNAAILEKLDSFEVGKMPCFKALLDESIFNAPISSAQEENLRDAMKRDEFDHVLKKLDYDQKVFEIWQSKCASVTVARTHARQEHVVSQHRRIVQGVENYLDGCCRFLTWEDCKGADSLIPSILHSRMEAVKKMKGKEVQCSEIPTAVFMNWCAPCQLPAGRQNDHAGVLTWALHDNSKSCGIVFSPVFSHLKGKTFLEENTALNILSKGGHNLDHQFSQ